MTFTRALRIALLIGFAIDFSVAMLSLFAQQLIEPLLDVAVKDPVITYIAGSETLVASGVYFFAFRDPQLRPLLWLCALDQTLAVVIPALLISHGMFPATIKTIGPMPFQAVLIAIYVLGARAKTGHAA